MATKTVDRSVARPQGGIVRFVQEAWQELAKVTWPTRETVVRFTLLVLLISAVVAVYIYAVDNVFTAAITRGLLGNPEATPTP